jgi:hypothetical protein
MSGAEQTARSKTSVAKRSRTPTALTTVPAACLLAALAAPAAGAAPAVLVPCIERKRP